MIKKSKKLFCLFNISVVKLYCSVTSQNKTERLHPWVKDCVSEERTNIRSGGSPLKEQCDLCDLRHWTQEPQYATTDEKVKVYQTNGH